MNPVRPPFVAATFLLLLVDEIMLAESIRSTPRTRGLLQLKVQDVESQLHHMRLPWQHHHHHQNTTHSSSTQAGPEPAAAAAAAAPSPYEPHANDLERLIAAARHPGDRWLTVFALTRLEEGSHELNIFLNTLTSYLLLGGGRSFIVAVATPAALSTCLRLRLPCYNASAAVPPEFLASYIGGTWAKVAMTRAVLRGMPSDLHLHFSDHDVVYLKRVFPSVERFAAAYPFDIAGQVEDLPVPGINTGVLFGRNTPRLHALYDNWVARANLDKHDQETFMRSISNLTVPAAARQVAVRRRQGQPLTTAITDATTADRSRTHGDNDNDDCNHHDDVIGAGPPSDTTGNGNGGVQADNNGIAVLARFAPPWLDGFWCRKPCGDAPDKYGDCYKDDTPDHCSVQRRLFVHTICLSDKVSLTRGLGLWFLDDGAPFRTNFSAIAAAGLPCAPQDNIATLLEVPLPLPLP